MPKEFREYFFHFTKVLYKDMVEIARKSDFEALKKNITELSKIVKELAAAQSKTEKRLEELAAAQSKTEAKLEELAVKTEKRLEELAVAQSNTEKRLEELAVAQSKTEARLEELAIAQSRTEKRLEELAIAQSKTEKRLEELAAAQNKTEDSLNKLINEHVETRRTEARLEELAIAQSKTEKRLEELAAAQNKTEDSLNKLINEHVETRRRLESMSDAVGYNLENQAYKALPALLEKDLKIKVEGKLVRRYFPGTRKGRYIQVNIYGWGAQNGKRILILGECKTSLSKKEVDRFLKLTKYIVKLENISEEETLKIAVVHDILPPVVSYLESKGIKLYWSYDL